MRLRHPDLARKTDRPDGAAIVWAPPGEGRPVLMIPGLGGDATCWGGPLLRALAARGLAAIIYDPRGLGSSQRGDATLTIELMAADGAALLAELGRPCTVLGWSMGASVALELALGWPHLVSGLVLCCGSADQCHLAPKQPLQDLLYGPLEKMPSILSQALFPQSSGTGAVQGESVFGLALPAAPVLEAQREALRTWQGATSRLSSIRCPVLAIAGRDDPLIPPEESLALARAVPNGEATVLPGGHGLAYSAPVELACAVAGFMKANEVL